MGRRRTARFGEVNVEKRSCGRALYPGPMRVYDAPGRRTLTLMEAAGGWLPVDPTHVLAEARWNMG